MTGSRFFEKGIIFRLLLSAILAAGTLLLINASKPPVGETAGGKKQRFDELQRQIDRGVDSVLGGFGIGQTVTRKKTITFLNSEISRIERRVSIPGDLPAVELNVALNSLAQEYGGRSVGSENTKEGTVTVHLEIGKTIVQTVILKPDTRPGRKGRDNPRR